MLLLFYRDEQVLSIYEEFIIKADSYEEHHLYFLLCCGSVYLSCPTLWDSMECSTSGFPVLHYLPEFAPIHVHWVRDAIQPSYPLSSPSHALNLCQHQSLFQWIGCSHQVAKVLELQLQHQSFRWIFRVDFLYDWQVWSPCSPRDSQRSSPAPQFQNIISSVLSLLLWSNSHISIWLLEKPQLWLDRPLLAKLWLCFLICCHGLS